MNALIWLVPVAIALGAVFVVLFLLAVKNGQFDDLDDPPPDPARRLRPLALHRSGAGDPVPGGWAPGLFRRSGSGISQVTTRRVGHPGSR